MNLFKREISANSISLLVWTLCSSLLITVSYWEYGLSDSADSMSQLFAGFPDIINTLFGVSPLGVNDVIGYQALITYYIYFIGVAYALTLGSKIIQKDIDDQTAEFLLTKPISRTKIFNIKSIVASLNIIVFAVINFGITTAMILNIGDDVYTNQELIKYLALVYVGLLLVMMITYFVAVTASVVFADKKYSLIAGGAFIMYSYATSVIILSFEKLNDFTIISPWRYFSTDVIVNDGFSIVYLLICLGIVGSLYFVAIKGVKVKSF